MNVYIPENQNWYLPMTCRFFLLYQGYYFLEPSKSSARDTIRILYTPMIVQGTALKIDLASFLRFPFSLQLKRFTSKLSIILVNFSIAVVLVVLFFRVFSFLSFLFQLYFKVSVTVSAWTYIYLKLWLVIMQSTASLLVGRVFANGPVDLGSIPGHIISKTLKWYLIPPCISLSIIRYISKVKWSNPGNRVAPSPTPCCSSNWKGSFLVALDYGRQLFTVSLNLKVYCF